MKQITLKTIKSMLGKTISKTMNYSGYINEMKANKKEIGSIYHNINDAFKRIFSNSPKVKDVLNVITQKISKDVPRGEFERLNDKENKRDRKKGHGRSR